MTNCCDQLHDQKVIFYNSYSRQTKKHFTVFQHILNSMIQIFSNVIIVLNKLLFTIMCVKVICTVSVIICTCVTVSEKCGQHTFLQHRL